MGGNKKTLTVVSISAIFALGLGIAIGTSIKGSKSIGDGNNNSAENNDPNLADKSPEELKAKLSELMLPEDEYVKLDSAITQTGVGLFMAQAQGAGVTVTEEAQQELKKTLSEKYSRKYFSDMNVSSMDFTKEELGTILGFYNTTAGKKFLEQSPKIIQTTMQNVQNDLKENLPKTVDALVAKLKGGAPANEAPRDDKAKPQNVGADS